MRAMSRFQADPKIHRKAGLFTAEVRGGGVWRGGGGDGGGGGRYFPVIRTFAVIVWILNSGLH